MNLFKLKSITHRIDGHKVYRTIRKPIQDIEDRELDESQMEFRNAMMKSISPDSYRIICEKKDPEYIIYTEAVRKDLIDEYRLHLITDSVKIGRYHGDQYVISFPKAKKRNTHSSIRVSNLNHLTQMSRSSQDIQKKEPRFFTAY